MATETVAPAERYDAVIFVAAPEHARIDRGLAEWLLEDVDEDVAPEDIFGTDMIAPTLSLEGCTFR